MKDHTHYLLLAFTNTLTIVSRVFFELEDIKINDVRCCNTVVAALEVVLDFN